MNNSQLKAAGWLCILSVLFAIPSTGLTTWTSIIDSSDPILISVEVVSLILELVFYIFVLSTFNNFLKKRLNFTEADIPIQSMMLSSIFLGLSSVFITLFPSFEVISFIAVIALLVYGAYAIALGNKIILIENDLLGFKKTLSLSFRITGIFTFGTLLSVYSLWISLLASMLSEIILAIIFFNASESREV